MKTLSFTHALFWFVFGNLPLFAMDVPREATANQPAKGRKINYLEEIHKMLAVLEHKVVLFKALDEKMKTISRDLDIAISGVEKHEKTHEWLRLGEQLYCAKEYAQAYEQFLKIAENAAENDTRLDTSIAVAADIRLGRMALEGLGRKKDLPGALKYFSRALEHDVIEERKVLTEALHKLAEDELAQSNAVTKQGMSDAFNLANNCYSGSAPQFVPNYVKAREQYEHVANYGTEKAPRMMAYLRLGEMYYFGQGMPKNLEKALVHYKRAEENATTDVRLQVMLFTRLGQIAYEAQRSTDAFGFFEKVNQLQTSSLEKVYARAFLGILYCRGLGIEKDSIKAMHLFEEVISNIRSHKETPGELILELQSRKKALALAQAYLGELYLKNNPVDNNIGANTTDDNNTGVSTKKEQARDLLVAAAIQMDCEEAQAKAQGILVTLEDKPFVMTQPSLMVRCYLFFRNLITRS